MAFVVAVDEFAVVGSLEAERAERNALVQLHVLADVASLADDDAGAVIDEKARADRCPWVDVDTRFGVRILGHHSRDVRHPEQLQLVRHAVGADRFEAGIAEDNLVVALRCRVAPERGFDVFFERNPHACQPT